jgi:hypothetical protein
MRRYAWLLIMLLCVGACATPYKTMGIMGGVDDLQLNDTTFQITVRGNAYTSEERVRDFVMLRASELALEHNYRYFTFGGVTDVSSTASVTMPGTATTTTTGFVSGTPYAASGTATSTTTVMPPVTQTFFKPGVAVLVTLNDTGGIDAQTVHTQLAPKYGTLQNW